MGPKLKFILISALVLVVSMHLYFGVGSLIGSIALITFVFLLLLSIIRKMFRKDERDSELSQSLQLSLAVLTALLFLAELLFRFGVGTYESYSEKNGGWIYVSPYMVKETSWSKIWQEGKHVYHPNLNQELYFEEYDYQLETNTLGFRHPEIKDKTQGTYRVLALGDSFTEGRGVKSTESWPSYLEQILNDSDSTQEYEVINAGISGSDLFFSLDLLLKHPNLQPDMVILAVNGSDIDDITVRGGAERYGANGELSYREGPWWEGLYANSFVIRHIVHDMLDYNWLFNKREDEQRIRVSAMNDIVEGIQNLSELGAEQEFEPVVVFHPLRHEFISGEMALNNTFNHVSWEKNPLAIKLSLGADVGEDLEEMALDYYWPIDLHHTATGYAAMAREIAAGIRKEIKR